MNKPKEQPEQFILLFRMCHGSTLFYYNLIYRSKKEVDKTGSYPRRIELAELSRTSLAKFTTVL